MIIIYEQSNHHAENHDRESFDIAARAISGQYSRAKQKKEKRLEENNPLNSCEVGPVSDLRESSTMMKMTKWTRLKVDAGLPERRGPRSSTPLLILALNPREKDNACNGVPERPSARPRDDFFRAMTERAIHHARADDLASDLRADLVPRHSPAIVTRCDTLLRESAERCTHCPPRCADD